MNMHTMEFLDHSGHVRVEWNPDNAEEVRVARETYDRMTGQGYTAFRIRRTDAGIEKQGATLTTFDPTVETMLLTPQLVGG